MPELLQGQIGVVYMPGAEGGHSTMPLYGITLKQYVNFTNNNVRDILAVSSEETDNRCPDRRTSVPARYHGHGWRRAAAPARNSTPGRSRP